MRNQNISQSNRASGKSHLVLRRFVILWPSLCSSDSTKHPYAFTTSLNFELLSAVPFNEVGDISSSIWKRIKVLLAYLILSLYRHATLLKSGSQSKYCIWQHKRAKPFGWTWAFKFRPSSCFRKQISVQEKANFLAASLEQSLPLLELCTFKFILHTVVENVSNRHSRTAAHNTRKVFLGSNPGRQGQRQFV